MGDRVSIQLGSHTVGKLGRCPGFTELSPVLYSHWAGAKFPHTVAKIIESIHSDEKISNPISRREPSAILIRVIQALGKESLRLYATPEQVDNQDNGHFIIWLDEVKPRIEKVS